MAKNPNWTKYEDRILMKFYKKESKEYITSALPGRNWCGIQVRASKLNLSRMNYFSNKDISFIKKNYLKIKVDEISKILNRDTEVIKNKARELGLKKKPRWTKNDDDFLLSRFNILSTIEISKKLHKSMSSIYHRIQELNLQRKTERYSMSNEELLKNLIFVSEKIGRTPSRNELTSLGLPSEIVFSSKFGSYGKACELSNLEVNMGITKRKKYLSKNGDLCLSNAEKKITDFLIDNDILFLKEVPYNKIIQDKSCGKMIMDWFLDDSSIVEYFGMSRNKKYAEKMNKKIDLCKKHGIKLIKIIDKDLNNLESIFKHYI